MRKDLGFDLHALNVVHDVLESRLEVVLEPEEESRSLQGPHQTQSLEPLRPLRSERDFQPQQDALQLEYCLPRSIPWVEQDLTK